MCGITYTPFFMSQIVDFPTLHLYDKTVTVFSFMDKVTCFLLEIVPALNCKIAAQTELSNGQQHNEN